MKLRKMQFAGIRAFEKETTFRFGAGPGLYFLQGTENLADPELGSNGVGKSTIWAILCWVLFGKTPEGLKAGDLKSWTSTERGYYCKLWLGKDVVYRSWNPNKLTFNNEVVEQKTLEDRIGLTFDTFVSAVVLAQGQDLFFDLSPTKKLTLFTSILDLDRWTQCSERAKHLVRSAQDALHAFDVEMSLLEGKIDGLGVEELEHQSKNYKAESQEELGKADAALDIATHDLVRLEKRIENLTNTIARKKRKQESLVSQIDELEYWCAKLVKHMAPIDRKLAVVEHSIKSVQKRIRFLNKNKDSDCSQCGQRISAKEATKQLHKHVEEFDARKLERVDLEKQRDRLGRRMKLRRKQARELGNKLRKVNNEVADKERTLKVVRQDTENMRVVKGLAEERWQQAKKKTNPYKEMLEKKQKQEAKLVDQLTRKKVKRRRMERRQERLQFWVDGFKQVRLTLIEEALFQLQDYTNKALQDLGMADDWRIVYSISRTTKRGSSIAGFDVSVISPRTDKKVPFAAWSGGEKQRLKMAGSMGFASLVSDRLGIDFGIEVYDEPTQHLSPEGIDNLLQALHDRALQTRNRIWLVDHHTLDYGKFAGHVFVSKDEEGRSSICQS